MTLLNDFNRLNSALRGRIRANTSGDIGRGRLSKGDLRDQKRSSANQSLIESLSLSMDEGVNESGGSIAPGDAVVLTLVEGDGLGHYSTTSVAGDPFCVGVCHTGGEAGKNIRVVLHGGFMANVKGPISVGAPITSSSDVGKFEENTLNVERTIGFTQASIALATTELIPVFITGFNPSQDRAESINMEIRGIISPGQTEPSSFATGMGRIQRVWVGLKNSGTSGATVVDVLIGGVTIFTNPANRPSLAFNAPGQSVVSVTPDVQIVSEGFKLDILVVSIAGGIPADLSVAIIIK